MIRLLLLLFLLNRVFVETSRRTSTCLSIVPRLLSLFRVFEKTRLCLSKDCLECLFRNRVSVSRESESSRVEQQRRTHDEFRKLALREGRSSAGDASTSSSNRECERESSRQTERHSFVRDKFKTAFSLCLSVSLFLSVSFSFVSLVFNTQRERERQRESPAIVSPSLKSECVRVSLGWAASPMLILFVYDYVCL